MAKAVWQRMRESRLRKKLDMNDKAGKEIRHWTDVQNDLVSEIPPRVSCCSIGPDGFQGWIGGRWVHIKDSVNARKAFARATSAETDKYLKDNNIIEEHEDWMI